jgi:hypothetical protein
MRALPTELRRTLERSVLEGRGAAEAGARAAVASLGVEAREKPSHLSDEQARLRRGLRAKQRQLGGGFELLVWECAYEQWHRLLFARYLAENGLLRHPVYEARVTLAECEELAEELGEPDGWSVAARFASEILPGIFRLDDPAVQLRLAAEHRVALEQIVAALPGEVFLADDSLGWVYQYWQSERKDQVNASEVKIGGADLSPVTQLFTENYMVRFLLENSLGAWWAARHPGSPLVKEFEYLRFDEDGRPAAGTFDGWPDTVAEVTVMDPCCGSGHFLVEAFGMLWRMWVEEEMLDPVTAQDAVLRQNLFGLELDPRCVQIAMFAVALTAWKQGGGWRPLPTPNIACSGIPAKAPLEEWTALAQGDERLERALERLHALFKDADTLGSLIDPRRATAMVSAAGAQRSFDDVDFDEVAPLLEKAAERETDDPATAVLGADAAGIARAATLLSRTYTLIATNVPYLGRGAMGPLLRDHGDRYHATAKHDLATVLFERAWSLVPDAGTQATVTPQGWTYLSRYKAFRVRLLEDQTINIVSRLGSGAFNAIGGEVVNVALGVVSKARCDRGIACLDVSGQETPEGKDVALRREPVSQVLQSGQLKNPDARLTLDEPETAAWLADFADSRYGLRTGDSLRFVRCFWELKGPSARWIRHLTTTLESQHYAGRSNWLLWEHGEGGLRTYAELGIASLQGGDAWGRDGVIVSLMGNLPAYVYTGERFDNNCAAVWPLSDSDLPALWAYVSSSEFTAAVRRIDQSLKVTNATLLKVPFDVERWRAVAAEEFPEGLPEPWSDDPTQWLFEGRPEVATEPLQVGVGRLVGYRWPEQTEDDGLDGHADVDGIVCLPAVGGEPPAADRLSALLADAYGGGWSPALAGKLLEQAGSNKRSLAEWLRDDFFKHHCRVFANRPFVWHIWDGRKDGFAALVNYHRLDRAGLEKLTYTYLGDWIERQRADAADEVAGADLRLAPALELRRKLEAILEGEPPFDIHVRWKSLAEQPIGWDPDLDDGVRLNIRPFVEAGVLRSKVNVHWKKDRGKNPDGSERHNDLHYTNAEKRQARQEAGTS